MRGPSRIAILGRWEMRVPIIIIIIIINPSMIIISSLPHHPPSPPPLAVPINRLLLETDGPYMAPMPFRGATAHSGMIPFTAVRMAQVKEVELEELLVQVRSNTKAIYGF